jgi:hypothetical protein
MGFRLLDSFDTVITRQRNVPAARAAVGAAASADIAIGDAYGIDANGNAFHAGADAVVRGVVVGFALLPVSNIMNGNGPISEDYLAAAVAGLVIGCEDPNATFEVWSDAVVGFLQANIGGKFNLFDVAPDSLFRQSRQYLNVNGGAGTQFVANDKINSPADNVYGPSCRVQVSLATALQP